MTEPGSQDTQRADLDAVAGELTAVGFEDVREIGRGGFGVVYRCRQPMLDRTVAVKVLTAHLDEENRARFFREQRAMGRLTGHPNIVSVLNVGSTASGRPYLVMQYHPQDSLQARLRLSGPLGWSEALRLGVKIAGALEATHRVGVLHRDVKPANILLTDYDDPQLTDFGIAHIAGAFQTVEGTITGSPAFTAPEVLAGGPPNAASDIYSLGTTLFCVITAHAPFERQEGEQVVAQFLRITTAPVPRLEDQEVPGDVREIVERAMARDPANRFATAEEFGHQLQTAQARHGLRVDDMAIPNGSRQDSVGPPSPGGLVSGRTLPGHATPNTAEVASAVGNSADSSPRRRGSAGNLPLDLTGFVGRRHEIAETRRQLAASRIVTLTGMGGVGKTRLALRVAHDARRGFANGVWLVELGELRDAQLVTNTISEALGCRHQSGNSALSALTEYLADKQLLLVFDNCEHLLEAVAAQANTLLRSCPGLRILATSREPVGLAGEVVLRVPPLSVPDDRRVPSLRELPQYESVMLFVERATTVQPDFELTAENQSAVTAICQRLDGLPLSIELAAVRLRAMSVQQVLDRLTDRLQLLKLGSRAAPSRQQTLRMSIDWSYELCSPDEQQLWARLTIFAGSFELDAADDICAGAIASADLLDLLAALVDKSIVIKEEAGSVVRYRLLETLRDYGREKLQGLGGLAVLRERHRCWYQKLVVGAETDWVSPRQLDCIRRLDREQPNLRDILRFCSESPEGAETGLHIASALFPYWISRGHLSEGRLWFGRLLQAHDRQPTADRTKVLYQSSVLAGMQGDTADEAALLAEADAGTDQGPDSSLPALAHFAAGCLALYSADPVRAAASFNNAVTAAVDENYLFCRIASLLGLEFCSISTGDARTGYQCHEEMYSLTEQHGEIVYRGRSCMTGGWALWIEGELAGAVAVLEEGLRLSSQVDDQVGVARCLQVLAWVEADQRHAVRAATLLGAAEGMWREIGGSVSTFLDKTHYQRECEQWTRRALSEREYQRQLLYGRNLGDDEAVAFALGRQSQGAKTSLSDTPVALTRREREVANLVAEGLTNRQIAERLVIAQRTAQGHVEHILSKLGFTSRTQIAAWVAGRPPE
ncbi:protein kinase [Rhodococcus oxybenzonivorans]|jgi:predicted ATPase/serine/threonine protein kinase/DNA-binding CsgD family transcriptional regulator|uniref:protein kinase domain-containing protein n=1 Tax=Rhodococcus TaxID=1827 RepID=UPI00202E95E1|nr:MULTISPECIES: protein kinase [Rhodococcus]MDV7355186.1 protein kinase [Rhodococcus oxybenzonivorans]